MIKNVNKYLLFLVVFIVLTLHTPLLMPNKNVNDSVAKRRLARNDNEEILEKYEQALPQEHSGLITPEHISESIGIGAILEECISAVKREVGAVGSFLLLSLSLTSAVLICSSISGEAYPIVNRSCSLIAVFSMVGSLVPLADAVASEISRLSEFLTSLLPILSGISVSLGRVASASAHTTAMTFALSIFGGEGARALVRIVKALFIVSALSPFGSEGARLSSTLRGIFIWGIGILTTLLGGVMSLQTIISRSADNAAIMATKYAISNMLPIAGGTVSGALSTLAGGMEYYVGVVGGGAVAVIVLSLVSPIITLIMYKLALSLTSVLASFTGVDSFEGGVRAVSGAMDALIALYSVTVVIYSIGIMLFLRQGIV